MCTSVMTVFFARSSSVMEIIRGVLLNFYDLYPPFWHHAVYKSLVQMIWVLQKILPIPPHIIYAPVSRWRGLEHESPRDQGYGAQRR